MPVIHITGIPSEARPMAMLRLYLVSSGVEKFWIVKFWDTPDTEMKEATIEVSDEDLKKIEIYLKKVPYKRAGIPYYLRWKLEQSRGTKRSHQEMDSHPSGGLGSGQEHSSYDDPETIDMEIEILKKKKLLLQEQKKLAAETQKLERMTEADMNVPNEPKRHGKQQGSGNQQKPSRDRLWLPPKPRNYVIPLFTFPIKHLFKKIKPLITKSTKSLPERMLVHKVISSQLRRTIAVAMSGQKERLASVQVVKIYRQLHPESEDRAMVQQVLDDIRWAFWPIVNDRPIKKPQPFKMEKTTAPFAPVGPKKTKQNNAVKKEVVAENSVTTKASDNVKGESVVKVEKPKVAPGVNQIENTDQVQTTVANVGQGENTGASQTTVNVGQGENTETIQTTASVGQDENTETIQTTANVGQGENTETIQTANVCQGENTETIQTTANIGQDENTETIQTTANVGQEENTVVSGQVPSTNEEVTNVENESTGNIQVEPTAHAIVNDDEGWVTDGVDWNDVAGNKN